MVGNLSFYRGRAMFEFYKENVKFYLKIAWYRYLLYLAMLVPIFLVATGGVFALRKINVELFNIAVTSIALAPIIIAVLLFSIFLLKFLFITGYSFVKHSEESGIRLNILSKIVTKVASPKFLLLAFIVLIAGYFIYSIVISDSQRLSQDAINAILFSVALTLLIYSVILFFIPIRHLFIHLISILWEVLPGVLWKLLVVLALLAIQLLVLGTIFFLVFTFITPVILG